jgi:DNA end-binding protein Ku
MAASVWSGYITFGLISIPVKLFSAARSESIGFNQLHRECGSRLKQQMICPVHDRPVTRDEIVKGYEYEKDRYITVEADEIKKVEPKTAKAMEILEFVPSAQVDPVYFDASYHLMPDEPGRKAYQLLKAALEKSGYLGIAHVSMHNREYTVVLRPHGKGLMVHSMFYQSEVRKLEEIGGLETAEIKDKELQLAHSLIESLAGDFDPSKYHDEFASQLRLLIEAKIQGQPIVEAEQPKHLAPVIDLMAALKQSLEQMKKTPGKASATAGSLVEMKSQGETAAPEPVASSGRSRRAAARPKR